jgi:hypothetical protein
MKTTRQKQMKALFKWIGLLGAGVLLIVGSFIFFRVVLVNLNPDKVKLEQDQWAKLFSFKTLRGTNVELYARAVPQNNCGEFVVVRDGVGPFGRLISPVFWAESLWKESPLYHDSGFAAGSVYELAVILGSYFHNQNLEKYLFAPSLLLTMYQNRLTGNFCFFGIHYVHCDGIPILNVFRSERAGPEFVYGCKEPQIYGNPLEILPWRYKSGNTK